MYHSTVVIAQWDGELFKANKNTQCRHNDRFLCDPSLRSRQFQDLPSAHSRVTASAQLRLVHCRGFVVKFDHHLHRANKLDQLGLIRTH